MPGFVKRHPDAVIASEACRRARVLALQGVPTPAAQAGEDACHVMFERIDGETGPLLTTGDLCGPLAVLARLHRARVSGLTIFDPFRRVRPRRALATGVPARDVLREPVPRGDATLHGDLHVGQFIRDKAGKVWIVDLDDLALGPPEADLANFTAHLATTMPNGDARGWSRRVLQAWQRLGYAVDGEIFTRFMRIAMVRRHLKLRAAARPDFETEVLDYLRASSNFSIR